MPSGQRSKRRFSLTVGIGLCILVLVLVLHFVPISTKETLIFTAGACPEPGTSTAIDYRIVSNQRSEYDAIKRSVYFDDLCSISVKHRLYVL